MSFLNPLPVAVLLIPVGAGLLVVRRRIEPAAGALALPGGYIDIAESWQEAAVREAQEESGVAIDAAAVGLFDAQSAPDGTLILFGLAPSLQPEALPPFQPTPEASERLVIERPVPLAFPLHTAAAAAFFAGRRRP